MIELSSAKLSGIVQVIIIILSSPPHPALPSQLAAIARLLSSLSNDLDVAHDLKRRSLLGRLKRRVIKRPLQRLLQHAPANRLDRDPEYISYCSRRFCGMFLPMAGSLDENDLTALDDIVLDVIEGKSSVECWIVFSKHDCCRSF